MNPHQPDFTVVSRKTFIPTETPQFQRAPIPGGRSFLQPTGLTGSGAGLEVSDP
jgi:hypothetical protein